MVGEHNSLWSRLREANPDIILVKCVCHRKEIFQNFDNFLHLENNGIAKLHAGCCVLDKEKNLVLKIFLFISHHRYIYVSPKVQRLI
jgi:hypothetical protein